MAIVAMWLVACASNQETPAVESTIESSASTAIAPEKKKVCKHERNSGGISRMKRVCRYVDVDAT